MIEPIFRSRRAGRPIRVAQLLNTMAHGGVGTAVLNWTRAFNRQRVDSRLICFKNPGDTEQAFVQAAARYGYAVELIPCSRWKPVWCAARRVADYALRHQIDLVHCHNTYANLVGLLAARMAPVRTVTTVYVWGDFGFKRNVLQRIDQETMRFFDQVTAHCETSFRETVRRGIPAARLELLVSGYPTNRVELSAAERDERRAALGATAADTVLLYFARFWPEKAHSNLLDAFRRVLDHSPRVLLWLPGVGPQLDAVRQKVVAMEFGDKVRFLGFVEDFMTLLAIADIQVHPSDNEGVPLSVLAGMAAAKPLVATSVGGLNEILRDGFSAILVPPGDPQRLAGAILQLVGDPFKASALGSAARRFLETEYSLEAAAARVQTVYERVVGA